MVGDGIVFVRVALRTGHRRAHPYREGRVGAIDDRGDAEFLVAGAAFVLGHRVPVEGGGDELVLRRVRQQVAGDLLDRESVEGQVAVDRPDHPIAITPDFAGLVAGITRAVGVAGEIEPLLRPVFAEGRLREERGDVVLIGLGRAVFHKGLDLAPGGRQSGEVDREAPRQGMAIGFGRGLEAFLLESGEEKSIDLVHRSGVFSHDRHLALHRRIVGPMFLILPALCDPPADQVGLLGRETFPLFRRRHHFLIVLAEDAEEQLALIGFSRHEGGVAAEILRRAFEGIQT